MIGAIYARYSAGPRQTDQSIEGQVAECQEYATRNDIQIVEIYADRHVSGKSTEGRWEFQRMLRDAEAGKFETLIVWKIDRFGRDRTDIAMAKLKLRKAGVRLCYAAESVPEGPEGIVLESVLEGIAEYYSAELRQKIIRGQRETVKKGLYTGAPLPLGYKTEDRRIVVDPEVAPLIVDVFERYAKGEKMMDLVAFLNDHGLVGARGAKITPAVVYRMLRNTRYLGIFDQYGVELRADPIISQELFDSVAAKFKKPHQNAAGRASTDFRLSCKCFCGYCGTMLVGESGRGKGGRVYYYYKCGKRKRGGKCELKPVPKDLLEDAVIQATVEDMLTDETISDLTDEILRIQEEEAEDPAEIYRKQLSSVKAKKANLVKALEEGTATAVIHRIAELEEEEKALEAKILREEIKKPRLKRETIEGWLRTFRHGDVSDPDFVGRLLDTFVLKVEVRNDCAAIYYNITDKKARSASGVRIRTVWWSTQSLIRTRRPFFSDGVAVLVIPLPWAA